MFEQHTEHDVPALLKYKMWLSAESEEDVLAFRRLLEAAMQLGYWGGFMGKA